MYLRFFVDRRLSIFEKEEWMAEWNELGEALWDTSEESLLDFLEQARNAGLKRNTSIKR